jgi:hypothetical protein
MRGSFLRSYIAIYSLSFPPDFTPPIEAPKMLLPDHINGLFELGGAAFLVLNIRRMHADRELKEVGGEVAPNRVRASA